MKISLSTLKVPLKISSFYQESEKESGKSLCGNSFFTFFDSKNAQIKEKRPSTLVLFNFKQLLFYDYPPKNASKYPKITIFKFMIFEKRPLRAPKTIFLTKSKCKSLQKYKIGIYIKFHAGCSNHLRGKTENLLGGAESPPPPNVTRVKHDITYTICKDTA